MVSSLAAQLQQLREGGAGSKRKTDSFLYDAREAAHIDDETVYNLAWNGLLELKQLDAAFDAFDPSRDTTKLFSRQRIHFHRVQIAKSEDLELSAAVARLLDALSPYFLLSATHKVLEFLVRRYEIHRYNVDDVMAMIISYHESKWFAKMVKLLHIHTTRWEFLLQVKQSEEPLLRTALVQRAIDERSVIEFIFASATRIGAANPKLISLYALVILQMLDQTAVNEAMLRWLIPDLLVALKTKQFPEMQAAAYMILTKLASKAVLSDKVVETLVKHLVKYAQKIGGGAQLNALLCVIYVAETQPSFALTTSVGKYVVAMDNLVDFLSEAASNYEAVTFIRSFFTYLIDTMEQATEDDAAYSLLVDVVARVGAAEYIVDELIDKLHDVAAESTYDLENATVLAASGVLVALSKKHVTKADACVQSLVASTMESATKQTKKKLNKFLEHTFGQVANSAHFVPATDDASTSLALALDHPNEHTRFQALQALEKQYKNASDVKVLTGPGVLLRRLHDDSARIVKLVAGSTLAELLLQLCNRKKAFDAIVQAVHKWTAKADAAAVRSLVDLLTSKFRESGSDYDEKLLVLVLSLVSLTTMQPKAHKHNNSKKEQTPVATLTIAHLWQWISSLDHPFAIALKSSKEEASLDAIAQRFGHALAEKDLTKLLPFCLSWSVPSDVSPTPLTSFLVLVLRSARRALLAQPKKTKAHKEYANALDHALRIVLKKEFVQLCQDSTTDADAITSTADLLAAVAADTFAHDVNEFDACVLTLLQAPAAVFATIQEAFASIFAAMEDQLLPTMCRVIVANYLGVEESDLLVVLAKIRALEITGAMIEGSDDSDDLECVVPVVVVALGDAHTSVREAALQLLDQWLASNESESAVLSNTTKTLLEAKRDIVMDARAVTTLVGANFAQDNGAFANLLVRVAADADLMRSVKLLDLLSEVKDTAVWAKTTTYAEKLLASLSADTSATPAVNVLKLLLGRYLVAESVAISKKTNPFVAVLLRVLQADKSLAELQSFALSRLHPAFYEELDPTTQHTLVAQLLALLMAADESVASPLIRCVSALPLTSSLFARLLHDELAFHDPANTTTNRPVRGHRSGDVYDGKEAAFLTELSCILEVLAIKVDDVATTRSDAVALLSALSETLALLCAPVHIERVSEYLFQVVFGCLRRVCQLANAAPTARDAKSVTQPELLVQHTLVCLARPSASPQTRNEALLFVSALVNVAPASVLQSLDDILKFLAAKSLDDEYSYHVLETIVTAVAPHVKANASGVTPAKLLQRFVDAFDQLPRKRRAPLFHTLVQTLGSSYLPVAVTALLENGVIAHTPSATDTDDRAAFAHQLCFGFDAVAQLAALTAMLKAMQQLYPHVLDDADTDTDGMREENDSDDEMDDDDDEQKELVFFWDAKISSTPALARQLNLALAAFIPSHLEARELHHEILRLEEQDDDENDDDEDDDMNDEDASSPAAERLQQRYLVLAQHVLLYFRRVSREQAIHESMPSSSLSASDTDSTAAVGFWGALAQQTIEILSALQQLLSTPGFVAVISELLHHDTALVRKKAMQLFNERLQLDRDSLTPGEELLFVEMLDELVTILQNQEQQESRVNLQTALLSVDILARNFAAQHAVKFTSIVPTLQKYVEVDLAASPSAMALHLLGCSFVSLASIARAVGPRLVPFLPKLFPKLLASVEFCSQPKATAPPTVKLCLLAALEVFTDHVAPFLTPYLRATVAALLLTSSSASTISSTEVQQLHLSVDASLQNLATHVDLRHLLPALFGSYDGALRSAHPSASVLKLLGVVSGIVTALQPQQLRQFLAQFARFFVTTLDLRRVHTATLGEDLDAVEDEALDVLVQFVLRLNEKQLKPLFLKIAEWTQAVKTPRGAVARRVVFFQLLTKLSDRLKSIFVPYYAHVLELLTSAVAESRDALAIWKSNQGTDGTDDDADEDDDFFAQEEEAPTTKKRKLLSGAPAAGKSEQEVPTRDSYLLQLQTAVRALNGCCVHDSDGFMDKDKFDAVLSPLVDTVDILRGVPQAKPFVLETVAECVANLAWAAKSDLLWKPLHYAVLMKSRDADCAAVRLASLKIVEKCYTVIGDEFLAMLPESIPFLAELMEDNDAEVEQTCHKVIKQIEEISGESLDQYLTS